MIEYEREEQQQEIQMKGFLVKVVGVGGSGSNVLDQVVLDGMEDAELVSMNTDVRTLRVSTAQSKLQLGRNLTHGLGAGGDPELGLEAAKEAEAEIRASFRGHDMVFICVGLGGGTGSGAAPFISRLAKEEGAFVVIFATMPFPFEGRRRNLQAENALSELERCSHALVTFDNDRMGELVLPKDGVQKAFEAADKIISQSVRAVAGIVNQPGLISIGMDDLLTALKNPVSRCLFGYGEATGKNRAQEALSKTLKSPLLDRGKLLEKAKNVLVHVVGGSTMTLYEVELLMSELAKQVNDDAQILFGSSVDDKLGDTLSITIMSSLSLDDLRGNALPSGNAAPEKALPSNDASKGSPGISGSDPVSLEPLKPSSTSFASSTASGQGELPPEARETEPLNLPRMDRPVGGGLRPPKEVIQSDEKTRKVDDPGNLVPLQGPGTAPPAGDPVPDPVAEQRRSAEVSARRMENGEKEEAEKKAVRLRQDQEASLAREQQIAERIARAKAEAEAERVAKEKAEAQKKAKAEAERLAREKAEAEKKAQAKAEAERLAKEKAEAEKKAKAEAERIAKEKAEAERIAKEKAEAERIAKEKAEAERIAKEKAEAEKKAKAEAEKKARVEAEKKAEAERIAKEKAEAEKKAQAEAERKAKEKAEVEKAARAKAEAERIAKDKAEEDRKEKERIAREKAVLRQRERLAEEKAELEKERLRKEQDLARAERESREAAEAGSEKKERLAAAKGNLAKAREEYEKVVRQGDAPPTADGIAASAPSELFRKKEIRKPLAGSEKVDLEQTARIPVGEQPRKIEPEAKEATQPIPEMPVDAGVAAGPTGGEVTTRLTPSTPLTKDKLQGELELEPLSKGRFDNAQPTVVDGENLDVPTFLRRKKKKKK
ncbi:MAG: hypothetical protein AAF514_07175 [Verrucomicrobiota bacterium]